MTTMSGPAPLPVLPSSREIDQIATRFLNGLPETEAIGRLLALGVLPGDAAALIADWQVCLLDIDDEYRRDRADYFDAGTED